MFINSVKAFLHFKDKGRQASLLFHGSNQKLTGRYIVDFFLQWQDGDFIITDNLAVAHMASAETQLPPSEVGLRILHRTTVQGKYRPNKTQPTDADTEQKDEL